MDGGRDDVVMRNARSEGEPARAEVDALAGAAVLEFGTAWCGICRAARPAIDAALSAHPDVRHLRVEDGPGRLLGRSFRVRLWPTLIFLRDGREVERLVRPRDARAIDDALARIDEP
jgi:thioredoxin